jgi:hypothetical protein
MFMASPAPYIRVLKSYHKNLNTARENHAVGTRNDDLLDISGIQE